VIFRFVDIVEIVDHHCLNFLYGTIHVNYTLLTSLINVLTVIEERKTST